MESENTADYGSVLWTDNFMACGLNHTVSKLQKIMICHWHIFWISEGVIIWNWDILLRQGEEVWSLAAVNPSLWFVPHHLFIRTQGCSMAGSISHYGMITH